jgi:hypothetical protein
LHHLNYSLILTILINPLSFLHREFCEIRAKIDEAITLVVSLRDAVTIKYFIATTITMVKDTEIYPLFCSRSHLLLLLANVTPSYLPHVCVFRTGLRGQQTLQRVTAACGAHGVEKTQTAFLTRSGYSMITAFCVPINKEECLLKAYLLL